MRKLKSKEVISHDCEMCSDFIEKGRYCEHDVCPYIKRPEPQRVPKKIYKRHAVVEESAPRVLNDEERKKLFPRKSVFERYDVKHIVFLHLKGYMMIEISQRMRLRPQEIAEVVRSYKKGELDVLL